MALRVVGRCVGVCRGLVTSTPALQTTRPSLCASVNISLPGVEQRRGYAMRLELTQYGILWRRPRYVPAWHPEKSGDLQELQQPEPAQPLLSVLAAKDVLEQADEATRRLLSVEFGARKEAVKIQKLGLKRQLQRHQYDHGSMEVAIGMLTVRIRSLQKLTFACKKNTISRVKLQELIDRRKKMLKHLRRMDYKRFEWLIQELGIMYRPHPRYYRWITRKHSLKKLVYMKRREIVSQRLLEYRKALDDQKEPFLKEKAETLKWIAETERGLGVAVSVEEGGEARGAAQG